MEHNHLKISERILLKLEIKHNVTLDEIEQCFANREKRILFDKRLRHQTNPSTEWFIAKTHYGRALKIVFIRLFDGKTYEIKTAYEPNPQEVEMYEKNV